MKQHPLHQVYNVLTKADNYSIVEHAVHHSIHECPCIPAEEGEQVYLFHKSIGPLGQLNLEYSILNEYEVGKSSTFALVSAQEKFLLVTSNGCTNIGLPISFRTTADQQQWTLMVNGLDLEKNRVSFDPPSSIQTKGMDLSVFKLGSIYQLKVERVFTNSKGTRFLEVHFEGQCYPVICNQQLEGIQAGELVQVEKYFHEMKQREFLRLTKPFILNQLYQTAQQYPFILVEIKSNPHNGMERWVLKDPYNYHFFYEPALDLHYPSDFIVPREGESVDLYVCRVLDSGYLDLRFELTDWKDKNYSIDALFETIGRKGKEEALFFGLKPEFEALKQAGSPLQDYEQQYAQGENLWVFSYLAFLEEYIASILPEQDWEKVEELGTVYLAIEHWILETSDYLSVFSPYKRQAIVMKAELRIQSIRLLVDVVRLARQNALESVWTNCSEQMKRTGYLNADKLEQMGCILQLQAHATPVIPVESVVDVLDLVIRTQRFSDAIGQEFLKGLGVYFRLYRDGIAICSDSVGFEEVHKKHLVELQALYLKFNARLNKVNGLIQCSIFLCRYLADYHGERAYLDLGIRLAVQQGYFELPLDAAVVQYDVQGLQGLIRDSGKASSHFRLSGRMVAHDQHLNLFPKHLWRGHDGGHAIYPLLNYEGISVMSHINLPVIDLHMSREEMVESMRQILNYSSVRTVAAAPDVTVGSWAKGRVKVLAQNGAYGYLKVENGSNSYDTLLHVKTFQGARVFEEMSTYLYPTDRIRFEVTQVKKGKISCSPAGLIESHAAQVIEQPFRTTAQIVKIYQQKVHAISQEGYPLVWKMTSPDFEQIGAVVEAEVNGFHSRYHYFQVTEGSVVRGGAPLSHSVIELYRSYLKETGVLEEEEPVLGEVLSVLETQKSGENNPDLHSLALFLVHSFEQRLVYVEEEKERLLHYFMLVMWSSFLCINKSYEYMEKLNGYLQAEEVEEAEVIVEAEVSPTEVTESPVMNPGMDAELVALLKTFDGDVERAASTSPYERLQQFIEMQHQLKALGVDRSSASFFGGLIQSELIALGIDAKDLKEAGLHRLANLDQSKPVMKVSMLPVTNLGFESKTREFKSSFFYSASETKQAEIILRTINGFLNSNEVGHLFLGVNDRGDVVGLTRDLEYLGGHVTLDQYLNEIISALNHAFPKEIATHFISFKFHQVNQLDYLEIIVKPYDQPVPLRDQFFQRQGNRTTGLKGNDLVDFIKRKCLGQSFHSLEQLAG